MTDSYDAATCITAGELRAMGAEIDSAIPDCGWIPRNSWKFGKTSATADTVGKITSATIISLTTEMILTVPFQWISITCTVGQ